MMTSKRRWLSLFVCLLALSAAPWLTVAGQETRAKDGAVMESLLAEVRGLRAAMEQLASAGPRVQLAMGRLQLQDQRLNAARRRLEDVRDMIVTAEREAGEGRDRLAMMEDAAPRAADASERDSLSAQVKLTKAMLAQKAADVQRLREQEAELTGVVGTEEARWTEISQRIDELERALTPRR